MALAPPVLDAAPVSAAGVLDAAAAALATAREAEVELLVAAVRWAELHPVPAGGTGASWGDPDLVSDLHAEATVSLAGPGAPAVAEFAPVELAARLGWSHEAAKALIADALELAHRLPRLWGLVLRQVVEVRTARAIAEQTRDLSADAATQADRMVCADPARIGRVIAARLVDEIRLWFDPDRAVADEEAAFAHRGVWSRPGRTPAVAEVSMLLDQQDADRFEHAVQHVAHSLGLLGDTDRLDVRRARAVGVLADPQTALDLITGDVDGALPARSGSSAVLYLHVSEEALTRHGDTGRPGPVSVERLGIASTRLVEGWLADAHVTVRSVLHLGKDSSGTVGVDVHDPPDWMRDLVIVRDAHCVFPGCRHDSRTCDLDHIVSFVDPADGGPPGQTHPGNLAPLCRTHHRAKTHAGFSYQRRLDGNYLWTLPAGDQITVIPTSRRPLTPTTP